MNDAPWTIYAGTQHLAPCKECGDRYVGCHGACIRYAEYKRKHKKTTKGLRTVTKWEKNGNKNRQSSDIIVL